MPLAEGRDLPEIAGLHWLLGRRPRPTASKHSGSERFWWRPRERVASMSRHSDLVRSFLEQLEARDHREGAILSREFSVSDTPAIKLRSQALPTVVHLCNRKAL